MNTTNAKTQNIEPDPKKIWRTKVLEAVWERDWHNMRSYLFFNVHTFRVCIDLHFEFWPEVVDHPGIFGIL